MLKDYLQKRTISIVFLGDFNPVIIQPFWLAHKKLIKEEEAQETEIELIHNELVKFDIGWANFEITKKRFEIRSSKEPYFEPVKDLTISIFKILNETPIEVLGLNHVMHFQLPNEERYFEFGNRLAPLSIWEGVLNRPRVMNFEIYDHDRKDDYNGYIRIKIQPSDQKIQNGVSININDHYTLLKDENGRNGEMLRILEQDWRNSLNRADNIVEGLWKKI